MLQGAAPGQRPLFGHVTHENERRTGRLSLGHELVRAGVYLRHRTCRRRGGGIADCLDGVDHDHVRGNVSHRLLYGGQLCCLDDEDPVDVCTETHGTAADLGGRLLGGDEKAPPAQSGHRSERLEQQG